VRSVLICVRTPLAAQAVNACAMRLGFADLIHTAVGGADALARIKDVPADLVLADTVSVRPDTVGFTRRARERSPNAVVVLLGREDPAVAQAAVTAGARGVIRGGDHEDLVISVAKALMLLIRPSRAAVPLQRSEVGEDEENGSDVPAPTDIEAGAGAAASTVSPTASAPTSHPGSAGSTSAASGVPTAGGTSSAAVSGVATSGVAVPVDTTADVAVTLVTAGGTLAAGTANSFAGNGGGPGAGRRLALTEREMQVLRGMADGKSNAEIGRELFVSEDTVKTHARRLFRKLGARDRAHAVAAAFRAGIVR
jgi:DNA-binding NarL/FixJ family response regulator